MRTVGLLLFLASTTAAQGIGTVSYERASKLANETGKPQHVLFVFGDKDAQGVASFVSMLRAANVELPHIVDLERCSNEVKTQAQSAISEKTTESYLQTIHPNIVGRYPYGREWWDRKKLQGKGVETYVAWTKSNSQPNYVVQYTGGYRYYYNYYPRRRGFFRRR